MPKLINVDEARAYAMEHFPSPVVRRPIEEVLDNCPAVKFESVVNCRDCKWLLALENGCFCSRHSGLAGATPDGFCNYGERRDEHAAD